MAKSSRPKQSRLKRILGWLKPTSPAKGALLFAIAFVVIGGGYMAYKSFAAGATWYPGAISWHGEAVVGTDPASHNSKNKDIAVLKMRSNSTQAYVRAYVNFASDRRIFVCFSGRGQILSSGGGNNTISLVAKDVSGGSVYGQTGNTWNIPSSKDYTSRCIAPTIKGGGITRAFWIDVNKLSPGGADVPGYANYYLSKIYLQY